VLGIHCTQVNEIQGGRGLPTAAAAECQALAKHMKAEIERIIAGSKTYAP
jgi:hypothetical protein